MNFRSPIFAIFLTVAGLAPVAFAQNVELATMRTLVKGTVHPSLARYSKIGPAESSLSMQRITLTLKASPDRQRAYEIFLQNQQDRNSTEYHHWLNPQEVGSRFGPSPQDVERVKSWLLGEGLTVDEVSPSGMWIMFSGTSGQIEKSFNTRISRFNIGGNIKYANEFDPTIPTELSDVVVGPVALHNIHTIPTPRTVNMDVGGSNPSIKPSDFATIYNLNPLYAAGIDGSGQSIAVLGRTRPPVSDWASYRTYFGLPAKTVNVFLAGVDPGDQGYDEDGEADLDVEVSGAIARGATINLVVAGDMLTSDPLLLDGQYVVNNNLSPVMTVSFGNCELNITAAETAAYHNLWQQAAAQGISVVVSSGDSGVACPAELAIPQATLGGVNALASSLYNVAVGGTQFTDFSRNYWNSTSPGALSYVPEAAWNESGLVPGGSGLWASGGGISISETKPYWQVAPGVPVGSARYLPDVSFVAAGSSPYSIFLQGQIAGVSGTSAATPAFAGILAMLVQATGQRQGNPNIRLYQLGSLQYTSGLPKVFNDVTTGNNSVPGMSGFSAGVGYDLVTGLGSIDATALVQNWQQISTIDIAGIYQSTSNSNVYLTVYQSNGVLLTTIYANTSPSSFQINLAGGSLSPQYVDYFILLSGVVNGLNGTIGGYDVFRSCNVNLNISFSTGSALTQIAASSPTGSGMAQNINCGLTDSVGAVSSWKKIL